MSKLLFALQNLTGVCVLKKLKLMMGAALFTFLVGCGADKGLDFVGHWIEVDTKSTKPATLKISYDGEVFHMDETFTLVGIDSKNKFDGEAKSDTTLSFRGGAVTMRLENNQLLYGNREFVKSP